MATNWRLGGLIPGCFGLHAKVSLGKILNAELLPMCSSKCGGVCALVNKTCCIKRFEPSCRAEKLYIRTI